MSFRTTTSPSSRRGARRIVANAVLFAVATVAVGVAVHLVRASAPEATMVPPPVPERDTAIITCEDVAGLGATTGALPGRASSREVVACPQAFDQRVVTYVGEVIGDVLRRQGGAWLLVNDDAYSLGAGPLGSHRQYAGTNSGLAVWLPDTLPPLEPGWARTRGTIIEVTGRLWRADPQDGGGLTLRALDAASTTVLAEAVDVDPLVHRWQVVAAAGFAAVAGLLVLAERRARSTR